MNIEPSVIHADVRRALSEDVGSGDITAMLIPAEQYAQAHLVCRESARLCGQDWFEEVFRQLDPAITTEWLISDGEPIQTGQTVCRLQGPARAILTGERTAINFLQTLSGTATLVHQYADAIQHTQAKLMDTRKTLPGLRVAQKYAVHCGGGHNQRVGLYDGILIKENHITAAGSITAAIATARAIAPHLPLQVEVENMAQLSEAVSAGVKLILLDNFDLDDLRSAVSWVREQDAEVALEASGNMDLSRIVEVAETGVDRISVGRLTKDVRAVDFSLRFTG
jgi:nicotinate-nucleotide pyrophosphorylase (carboxylating)